MTRPTCGPSRAPEQQGRLRSRDPAQSIPDAVVSSCGVTVSARVFATFIVFAAIAQAVACSSRPVLDEADGAASGGSVDVAGTIDTESAADTTQPSEDSGGLVLTPDSGTPDSSDADVAPGDTATKDAAPDVAGSNDTASSSGGSDAAADAAVDGESQADGTTTQDGGGSGACPGGAGCDCAVDKDCNIGLCVLNAGKFRCAQPCVAGNGDCAQNAGPDTSCQELQLSDGAISVCLASDPQACDPCTKSEQCAKAGGTTPEANACVLHGVAFGSYCGIACTATADCPTGYSCEGALSIESKFSKQCVPVASGGNWPGSCDCSAAGSVAGFATECTEDASDGSGGTFKCAGKRTCTAQGLGLCTAVTQLSAEVCDGFDNDCDGEADELTCNDDDPCTLDTCDQIKGECVHVSAGDKCCQNSAACDDGKCATLDFCTSAHVCEYKAAPQECLQASDCDDGDACTLDTCDNSSGCGKCVHKEGAACCKNDKDCLGSGACAAAQCSAGKCGVKLTQNGTACDDGSACTDKSECQDGACAPAKGQGCDDGNPCTTDVCSGTGTCSTKNNQLPCSDESACAVGDACSGGVCLPGVATACDDSTVCTFDSCDKIKGCVFTPADVQCNDGNPCTTGEKCVQGACKGGTDGVCACQADADCGQFEDGDLCTGALVCKDKQCVVKGGSTVTCATGLCTKATCNPKTGSCVLDAGVEGGKCDDGDLCTIADACSGGVCVAGKKTDCDDGNACTSDGCNGGTGCTYVNVAKGTACSDANACTSETTCVNGLCSAAKKKDCNDLNACTVDSCNPDNAQCVNKPIATGSACDDGDACTSGDVCALDKVGTGVCKPTQVKNCDDGNSCTLDSCDANSGVCASKNKADDLACGSGKVCQTGKCVLNKGCAGKQDGAACDDADACTSNDACTKGKCGGGASKSCDDNNNCTKDVCDPFSGQCSSAPNGTSAPCEDGNVCSVGDACKDGKCAQGSAKSCDDGNSCTVDACDQLKGCNYTGVAAGAACDDGNKCTDGDFCQDKACKPGKYTCPGVCGDNVCSEGENCGICEQDCGICLGDAEVEFSLAPASPGYLSATSVDRKESRYDQALGALVSEPPGDSGTATATSGPLKGSASYATRKEPAASITAIVRTTDVWRDLPAVAAIAQLRDKDGRSQVASTSVTLRLKKAGHGDVTATCSPNAVGICDVKANVPASWFETGKATTATITLESGKLAPTTAETIKLAAVPLYKASPSNGAELTLPLGPRLPQTTFVVPITAYTSGQPLESFDYSLKYDSKLLEVTAVKTSSDYDAQQNVKTSEVLLVGVRKSGVAGSKVTGKVHIANVTMRVRKGTAAAAKGLVSGVIKGMFNVQNVPLVPTGTLIAVRGPNGTDETGEVSAAATRFAGSMRGPRSLKPSTRRR